MRRINILQPDDDSDKRPCIAGGINETAHVPTEQKCISPLAGQSAELVQCNVKYALTVEKNGENYSEMRPLMVTSGFNQSELEM